MDYISQICNQKFSMISFFNKKKQTTNRLILICSTWCLEPKLREEFGTQSFFMTALGGMFSFDKSQIEQVKSLVNKQSVNKICVVANPNCRFVKNIINPNTFHNTKAEELLAKIYHKKYDEIKQELTFEDKCRKLSIYRAELQIAHIKRHPEVLALIENHNIEISVMVNHVGKNVM